MWVWLAASQSHGAIRLLADVYAVEVIGPEGGVALGALPLARVVSRFHALEAEDVEALGQHGVLHSRVTARAGQTRLGTRKGQKNTNQIKQQCE